MVSQSGSSLRVALFGTPEFAVASFRELVASRHPVVVAISQPDRPRGRGRRSSPSPVKHFALERGIPVLQPDRLKDPPFAAILEAFTPDIGVVAAYGRILPDELLSVPRLGMVNVHASLLPKYRGAAPVQRAILMGEPLTGVTIMRVVRDLDAGPIFATARRPIGPDETSEEVEHDLAVLGARLLTEVLDLISEGRAVESPQDHSQATYAPRLTKGEGLIDWNARAQQIHDKVRALHPWPHAYTYLRTARYIVLKTGLDAANRLAQTDPGTVVDAAGDVLTVGAGDARLVRIVEIQPEGRRAMTAREFLAGHAISPGDRFGNP